MRDELLFIDDIIESIDNIEEFSKGLSKERFMKDKLRQSAIVRQFEIIGEAVKNISDATKTRYPAIEWKKIAGSRDIFIHAYFGVNLNRIWDIIETGISVLKKQIKKIKEDLEKQQ